MSADEFAQRHAELTRRLALHYSARFAAEDRTDVASDAWLGLAVAAETYNPNRGASETTHVINRVRLAVHDGYRERNGRTPAQLVFAAQRRRALRLSWPLLSTDGLTWADVLVDDHDPVTPAEDESTLAQAQRHIQQMTGRRRDVLARTYVGGETLLDLANEWGITESRVAQIRRAALADLRILLGLPAHVGRSQGNRPHPCGTAAGFARHVRSKETPCTPCRLAWNRYSTNRRRRRAWLRGEDVT